MQIIVYIQLNYTYKFKIIILTFNKHPITKIPLDLTFESLRDFYYNLILTINPQVLLGISSLGFKLRIAHRGIVLEILDSRGLCDTDDIRY